MGLLNSIIKTFIGDKTKKDLKQISPLVDKINQYQKDFESLDHDKLRKKTEEFKSRLFDKNKIQYLPTVILYNDGEEQLRIEGDISLKLPENWKQLVNEHIDLLLEQRF